ncbi:hypothetical protein SNE40_014317 [Patella caerulea]|uniref:FLYWCH-type domain-containing protein n=1 Tax=Patella caerulea TaxID=87958 RepID=A0AAN8JGQ6_PATCE
MANVQVNILYIPNAQGGENLVHEEYKFRVKNRKAERVYWRCCIKGCPATLNTHQGFITKYSRNHNHVANQQGGSRQISCCHENQGARGSQTSLCHLSRRSISPSIRP